MNVDGTKLRQELIQGQQFDSCNKEAHLWPRTPKPPPMYGYD